MSSVCFKYQTGECTRGDSCRFSHVIDPNAAPPARDGYSRPRQGGAGVCYAFQRGECDRGDSCRFSHSTEGGDRSGGRFGGNGGNRSAGVCYAFQRGECDRGSSCRFSHSSNGGERGRSDREWRDRSDGDRAPRSNVCYKFQRGECTYGDSCRFSHEVAVEN